MFGSLTSNYIYVYNNEYNFLNESLNIAKLIKGAP
jgi:hypothetical protein